MIELTHEECQDRITKGIKVDAELAVTIATTLHTLDQPVSGVLAFSHIVRILQDYNRDDLLNMVATSLFLKANKQ